MKHSFQTSLLTLVAMFFMLCLPLGINAQTYSVNYKGTSIEKVIKDLREKTGKEFVFQKQVVANVAPVTCTVSNAKLKDLLDAVIKDNAGLDYEVVNNSVVIKLQTVQASRTPREVNGMVVDENGDPLPGATITARNGSDKRETAACVTDLNGHFKLTVPSGVTNLEVSYIGYDNKIVNLTRESSYRISMQPDAAALDEVVVNGAFTRKANTFTGAVTTVKGEELQRIGNMNVLQSLKNIDPSFLQVENLSNGSNPNALPDFQMRGGSTIASVQGEYASSANQPLFILDGFETELTKILDLDMNQVESLTTLKDATAKAIYGSKAANGVIVIETKRPNQGRLRVNYTGALSIEAADLSSYDMCNAAEKLEVERLAGVYSSTNPMTQMDLDRVYAQKLLEVLAGVETDWMYQPLRTGVGNKHSLYVEGGDKAMQYGINLAYNRIEGVMKGSDRNTFTGGMTMAYRVKNFLFRDKLTIDYNDSDNSPYGVFNSYYQMNPYSRLYDERGNYVKSYNYINATGNGGVYYNPLYNTTMRTKDNSTYTTITNNFYAEWQATEDIRVIGRFGIVNKNTTADIFKPANHTDFINIADVYRKGSYSQANGKYTDINADLGASYGHQFGKHLIFGNAQLNMSSNTYDKTSMLAEGFPNDFMDDIKFGVQYAKDQKPMGDEGISRSCGGLLSLNYSFDERYLFDANYRLSGSSETGRNNRWGSFWSVGAGWNIQNEAFMQDLFESGIVNRLKLRASYGYTGSQGFSSYDAYPMFTYYSKESYNGAIGSYVKGLANKDLRWQQKYDTNIGLDFTLLNNRLTGRFDYYLATTDGMITAVTVPGTTGFTTYMANLGKTENKGFEAYLNWRFFQKNKGRDYINVYASVAHNKNTLKEISSNLRAWNEAQDKNQVENAVTAPSVKYYEGCSMNAIWAVKSLGIDPQNGKEIYVKKDGTTTYEYNVNDQVVCGDMQPKFNGNIGFNGEINGWGFTLAANYRWGGQMYNQTLVNRVENAPIQYNADRRVFTDRWQKPGDMALYKAITDRSTTLPTSRFVEDYNLFTLSSLSVYYDFRNCKFVKDSFLERLKVSAYTNDLFVISSVKTERGTDYPFARTFSLQVQLTF